MIVGMYEFCDHDVLDVHAMPNLTWLCGCFGWMRYYKLEQSHSNFYCTLTEVMCVSYILNELFQQSGRIYKVRSSGNHAVLKLFMAFKLVPKVQGGKDVWDHFLEQFFLPSHGEEKLVSVDFCNNGRMYGVYEFLCGVPRTFYLMESLDITWLVTDLYMLRVQYLRTNCQSSCAQF